MCVPAAEAPRVAVGPTSDEHSDSDASCPKGTKAIAGGFVARSWYRDGNGLSTDRVTANAPNYNGRNWYARLFYGKVEARALCS